MATPSADGSPGSLIDVLHRLCVFREKNDTDGMVQFLARSGQANNPALWIVAQAVSEILPDGDKEKQLMQGLLNQKERIEQAGEQGRMLLRRPRNMPDNALYYPYIDPPNRVPTLATAMLYWDRLYTIVPSSITHPYERKASRTAESLGFLRPRQVAP